MSILSRTTTAVLGLAIALSGCSGGDSGTSPPSDPITSSSFESNKDINYVSNESCYNGLTPRTGFEFFSFTHQSGSTDYDQHSYWTVRHPQGGYQLYVNSSGLSDGDLRSTNSEAVSAWTSSLQAHRTNTSAYTITLTEDSNGNDPVTEYQSQGYDPGDVNAKGRTDYYQVSASGMQQKADVTFYMPQLPDRKTKYNVAMHELGHTMTLAHNPSIQSFMVDENTAIGYCWGENQQPLPADYQPLEDYYDPILRSNIDNGGDGTTCKGSRCYMAAIRSSFVPSEMRPPYPKNSALEGWYHIHDFAHAKDLTPDSLFVGSSLVAQGSIIRDVGSFVSGLDKFSVHEIKLSSIYRHDADGLKSSASGDNIYVVDARHRDGLSYRDDPALEQRQTPIMFLRPADTWLKTAFRMPKLYQFTAQFVSKWNVEPASRKIRVAGYARSQIRSQIDGTDATTLFRRASSVYGTRAVMSEHEFVGAILARRGIIGAANVARYEASLRSNPAAVLKFHVRYDQNHQRQVR